MKSLPGHLPEAWKKKNPFQAEPPSIGHHREYTSAYRALEGGKPLKKLKEAYARLAYEQQTGTTRNTSAVRKLHILVGKQKLNLSRRPILAWLLKETEFNSFIGKNMVLNALSETKTCDEHPRHDFQIRVPGVPGWEGGGEVYAHA